MHVINSYIVNSPPNWGNILPVIESSYLILLRSHSYPSQIWVGFQQISLYFFFNFCFICFSNDNTNPTFMLKLHSFINVVSNFFLNQTVIKHLLMVWFSSNYGLIATIGWWWIQDLGKYQWANFVRTNQLENETYNKVYCILYYWKIVHYKNKFTYTCAHMHTHACIFFSRASH